jgi:hypothetical protein
MWLSELSIEAWTVIIAVIGCCVLLSLRTLADKLHYETTLHNLKLETRRMRQDHARRLEAPLPNPRRAAPASTATPVPTKAAPATAALAPLQDAA